MSNATTIKVNGVREFIPEGVAVAIDKDGYLYRLRKDSCAIMDAMPDPSHMILKTGPDAFSVIDLQASAEEPT